MFSNANMNKALEVLMSKKDTRGYDGLYVHELPKYLSLNRKELRESLLDGSWEPGYVQQYEIVNRKGKVRIISNASSVDKFVSQCIYQSIVPLVNQKMVDNSYAYQKGKSVLDAAKKCRDYVSQGKLYVLHLDIHHFFGSLNDVLLQDDLLKLLNDRKLVALIMKLVQCDVVLNHSIQKCTSGIIEGSILSPCLSNLYLSDFDSEMKKQGYCFVRYADDMHFFVDSIEEALDLRNYIEGILKEKWKLSLNDKKTKVEESAIGHYFGYTFRKQGKSYTLRRGRKNPNTWYREWMPSALTLSDGQYHIMQEGILSRKDFTVLFENEENKEYFPVNVVSDINVYAHEVYSSDFFSLMNEKKIQVHMFNDHGEPIGTFTSNQYEVDASVLLLQVKAYIDPIRRTELARGIELSQLRNLQSELRYYRRHKSQKEIDQAIGVIGQNIHQMKLAKNVNELSLLEARSREVYYNCFQYIVDDCDFQFNKRTRRPPKDAINAMISFGNVFLYNRMTSFICRTKLDNRISFVHSSQRRKANLCFDLADVYKPLIVDPVIFSLINRHQMDIDQHFELNPKDNGIYLTREGCVLFVKALKRKMGSYIKINEERKTYSSIICDDLNCLVHALKENTTFSPFVRKS